MSTFGGGFGGFGSSNNQQQNTGFGGFGSSSNTNTGFGSSNTGFGANNTTNTSGGGLFGNTSTGFGSGGAQAGFGSSNSGSLFGSASKPAFGASNTTSSGGLFGNNTATAGTGGFGGFGSSNTNTASTFGSGNTGGSLFGSGNKTSTFGGNASTGSNLFGGSGSTGFGASNTGTNAFGGGAGTALGGVIQPSEGTGTTPFQAYTDKEGNATGTNHYQTITFMQPYQKYSLEELRCADYIAGRRFGNANGQAGAFGQSNTFGGFGGGSTAFGGGSGGGGGLFGSNSTNTATGFGSNSGTGFGSQSNNTGGLFGNSNKSTGSLFGSTASSAPSGGGLFGTSNNTTTGFGGNSGSSNLFGASNNTTTGFGSGTSTGTGFGNTGATAFGNNTTSSGGLFGGGSNNATTGFGSNQNQQGTGSGGLFGGFGQNQQTQQPQQNSSGSLFGGFGAQNQQKPAGGLFGTSNNSNTTGGGLFGATNNTNTTQQPSGGLFGNASTQNQTGGLFGQNKTNTTNTGGGLFGGNTNSNSGGSGLFGSLNTNNANQSQGTGLFGATNSAQKPGGLFGGSTTTTNPSGGLFGSGFGAQNSNTQSNTGGLFGSTNNQNQQPQASNSLFGANNSLLGSTQQSQQQQTPQQSLMTTSLLDGSAFGNSNGLFSSYGSGSTLGPLATPLSASRNQKKSVIIPNWRMQNGASRFGTPTRRGYGFSYSTYGTPGSGASSTASTPMGLNSSFLGGSLSRSLGKSLSTSNLRRNFDGEESVLAPGAFSASSNRLRNGSALKKLTINRSIRGDLFASPSREETPPSMLEKADVFAQGAGKLKKRVSFDTSITNSATPSAEEQGFLRSSIRPTQSTTTSEPSASESQSQQQATQPEMTQVRGNELEVVPENESSTVPVANKPTLNGQISHDDQQLGEYYMSPTKEEIKLMTRDQLKKVSNLTVGREGAGSVTFNVPVDLTGIPIEDIFEKLVRITVRSLTVYPQEVVTPEVGKGLNVPATIALLNSWPRARGGRVATYDTKGPKYQKHIERLKRVPGTIFKDYNANTGTWTFDVEHFTTYGLDYDDETEGEDFGDSVLSAPPDIPTPPTWAANAQNTSNSRSAESNGHLSSASKTSDTSSSSREDTFQFKRKAALPGAFTNDSVFLDEEDTREGSGDDSDESFLDERSVGSPSETSDLEPQMIAGDIDMDEGDESVLDEDEMAGSYPVLDQTTEHMNGELSLVPARPREVEVLPVKTALKAGRRHHLSVGGTPAKAKLILDGDWTQQLERTVSPKKQDRQALREAQDAALQIEEREQTPKQRLLAIKNRPGFRNNIDLMHSLWGQVTASGKKSPKMARQSGMTGQGMKWPYSKKSKTFDVEMNSMSDDDRAFYESFKPSWSQSGTLIFVVPYDPALRRASQRFGSSGILPNRRTKYLSADRDLQFTSFDLPADSAPKVLSKQLEITKVSKEHGVPFASIPRTGNRGHFKFTDLSEAVEGQDAQAIHEKLVWELANILFDSVDKEIPAALSKEEHAYVETRVRKEKLSSFWVQLVQQTVNQQVGLAKSNEEQAIAYLSAHNVEDACAKLIENRDFRLATLISMIGGDKLMKSDMQEQLDQWRSHKLLSEFEEPVRAMYEMLAGNVCFAEGVKGAPEDRATTFVMSERFGFTWKQAFGMRLWYGILGEDPIDAAVKKFKFDLDERRVETARPVPWFVEQKIPPMWEDPELEQREELLWGLLKLFTAKTDEKNTTNLAEILQPHNHQLSPIDYRFAWQLHQTLSARGIADFVEQDSTPNDTADRLTLDYAWQLERSSEWVNALFVLLHLRTTENRKIAIQNFLARHAGKIDGPDSKHFSTFVHDFHIPEAWIWEAKVLYARSVDRDYITEAEGLLKAHNWNEAHKTLCGRVAPQAIVEGNTDTLKRLLSEFTHPTSVPEWNLGGQVYLDFLQLQNLLHGGPSVDSPRSAHKQKGLPHENNIGDVTRRLVAALPAMLSNERHMEFMQKVAIQEMSRVVAKALMAMKKENDALDVSKVLQLPLTEDVYMRHTVDLSLDYYRSLMAGGK